MTVQNLLANMTQKELCHWMAYYKIKNEKYEEENPTDKTDGITSSAPVPTPADSQEGKDELLLGQLLALAGQK